MVISVRVLSSAYSFSNLMATDSRRARKRQRRPSLNSLPARWTRRPSAHFCAPTRSERKRDEADSHIMELVVAGHADSLVTRNVKDLRGGRALLRRALTYARIDRF